MNIHATPFTLSPSEIRIALSCIQLVDDKMDYTKSNEQENEPKVIDSIPILLKKLKEKEGQSESVQLDHAESILLHYAIIDSVNTITKFIEKHRNKVDKPNNYQDYINIFEALEDEVPDILWRLNKVCFYNEAGLDVLENIFNIKTGVVRPLRLDTTQPIVSIRINRDTIYMFSLIFRFFIMLEKEQAKSKFAQKLSANQYINIRDMVSLQNLLIPSSPKPPKRKLYLTQYTMVLIYWFGALAQRMFISDASMILDQIIEPDDLMTLKETRSFILRYFDSLLPNIAESLKDDKIAKPYLEMVNQWDIPMDLI